MEHETLAVRKIGQYEISVVHKSSCAQESFKVYIVGDTFSNQGLIYTFRLNDWLKDSSKQILGMEWGGCLTQTNLNTIYGMIRRLAREKKIYQTT